MNCFKSARVGFLSIIFIFLAPLHSNIQGNLHMIPCNVRYFAENFINDFLMCFNFEKKKRNNCLVKYIYNGDQYNTLKKKNKLYLNRSEKIILKDLEYILNYQAEKLKSQYSYYFSHRSHQWLHKFYPSSKIKIDFYEIYNKDHFKIYITDNSFNKRFAHLEILNIHQSKMYNLQKDQKGNQNKLNPPNNLKSNNQCLTIQQKNNNEFNQKNWRIIDIDGFF
jgi:hypothetical protein